MIDPALYLIVVPSCIPLLFAGICLIWWSNIKIQARIAMVGSVLQLVGAGALFAMIEPGQPLALALGNWAPPLGISFVMDSLGAAMTLLTAIVGVIGVWYGYGRTDEDFVRRGYCPLMLAMLGGVAGAFATGDIFNLFVWFEILLMASFVLLGLGRGGWRAEGAVKYLLLNLISSAIFLSAVGLLYAQFGTLNMAQLAEASTALAQNGITDAPLAAWLLLTAFAIKAGLFPCYIWLPGAYHVPPPVVSAVFAALLTKVGIYALIRTTTLMFHEQSALFEDILLVMGLATMISGALGALAQQELRRILSFHVISQVVAVGLGSAIALGAAYLYIIHHIIVKGSLFLIGGLAAAEGGSERLSRLGGLAERSPILAILFLIPALSLAGVPPFSGFVGKLAVVQSGIYAEAWLVVAICLGAGILTLLSMLKIWLAVFWGKKPAAEEYDATPTSAVSGPTPRLLPAAVLVSLTVIIGFAPNKLAEKAIGAGEELANPHAYIAAVHELQKTAIGLKKPDTATAHLQQDTGTTEAHDAGGQP
jgi:multicomponent Na+:H+ antiporter subunit D